MFSSFWVQLREGVLIWCCFFLQVQHFCDLVNVGIPGMCKLSYFFALYLLVFQLWDDMDRRFQFFPFFWV